MLTNDVTRYLSVRRTGGFGLKEAERYLRSFTKFAENKGDIYVRSKTAIEWASQSKPEAQRANRLKLVVRLARFLRTEDNRHEVPPDDIFCGRRQRPTPYIFSQEEITALVRQAARLGAPATRGYTYSTLFGLIAVTGLRPSEALSLQFKDFGSDGIVIRESKHHKSRLVPLHKTTVAALNRYLRKRRQFAGCDQHIFVSRLGKRFRLSAIERTFRKVLREAGIPSNPDRRSPRLMDLRHSFAVRALKMCPDDRDHIGDHMLALTTYMGHARVESTYWYLESTPELMRDIASATETFFKGVQS